MNIIFEDEHLNEIASEETSKIDFENGLFFTRIPTRPYSEYITIKIDSDDLRKMLNRYFDYNG